MARRPHSPERSIDVEGEFPHSPEEYFFYLLFQAVRQRDLSFGRALESTGLNLPRWRALAVIRRIADCTMSVLAKYSTIDRTTLTRSVDQLVEEGLVARFTPPRDRRKVSLRLTEQGEAVYDAAIAIMMARNAKVLAGVEPARLREATRVLQTVLTALSPDPRTAAELVSFGRPPGLR